MPYINSTGSLVLSDEEGYTSNSLENYLVLAKCSNDEITSWPKRTRVPLGATKKAQVMLRLAERMVISAMPRVVIVPPLYALRIRSLLWVGWTTLSVTLVHEHYLIEANILLQI